MSERRLVFTSAGDRHRIHPTVRHGAGFDLAIYFYGDNPEVLAKLSERGGLFVERKGGKFPNLLDAHQADPGLLSNYDAVFVLDDDLGLSANHITTLFDQRQKRDLWIVQPAFDRRGHISFPISKRSTAHSLRYVNFIELNAPLYRSDMLVLFLNEYDGELVGWGIDWWYMQFFGENAVRRYAIIDDVVCKNPPNRDGVREIERLASNDDRRGAWEAIRDSRDMHEYPIMETDAIPLTFIRRLIRTAWAGSAFIGALARPGSPRGQAVRDAKLWVRTILGAIRELAISLRR